MSREHGTHGAGRARSTLDAAQTLPHPVAGDTGFVGSPGRRPLVKKSWTRTPSGTGRRQAPDSSQGQVSQRAPGPGHVDT
eukprot:jgi/Botrbrau1/5573/Bobra.97_2s0004.1